jgi:hypothetical protein
MVGERNLVAVAMQCREVGWNMLLTLEELGYVPGEGVSNEAVCIVSREGVGKKEAVGNKRKEALPIEKTQ